MFSNSFSGQGETHDPQRTKIENSILKLLGKKTRYNSLKIYINFKLQVKIFSNCNFLCSTAKGQLNSE